MDVNLIFKRTARAAGNLVSLDPEVIGKILLSLADKTVMNTDVICSANEKDLERMDPSNPMYDRLRLTPERIKAIACDIRNVASLPAPTGRILYEKVRDNGLVIKKISVPLGVVGVIYEARPNVTFDVFSLCLKSGNACILKGGSDAVSSNSAIVKLIKSVLLEHNADPEIVNLLPGGREEAIKMMNARRYVDVIIPRGSQALIDFVRKNSSIPVIETGAGICHTYFDESGNREKGRLIINNAKTRRVSVCNALDCLIIHEDRLADLPYLVGLCAEKDVLIFADEKSYDALKKSYPPGLLQHASKESFGTEFLSYKMAVKTVASIHEAMDHIARYSSKHSEAIIAEDREKLDLFCKSVDAAAVYTNASTAFTDGAEFGLGAEIGISTQKLHARGPMGLQELTTYKWIVEGDGQTRNN